MSNDFSFDIAPANGHLRITVSGGNLPPAGREIDRPLLDLSQEQVDKLRSGEAPPALVWQVMADVSEWLLAEDLDLLLHQVLGQQHDEPLRLIFTVRDEKLLSDLADVPFELLALRNGGIPLVLRPRVASLVHLLPDAGVKAPALAAGKWPFRVLILHSNPLDLGGQVPDVAPMREEILRLRDDLGARHLQVDVLSRQDGEGVAGPPTYPTLVERLKRRPYDVLIYLGHGDLEEAFQDLPPVGVLQLEDEDGQGHTTVFTDKLAQLLHDRPVPVVLLVGCLTAAQPVPDEVRTLLPQWMRGSQGVTQALVNSESGVQFAVGMRYKIEAPDATCFLIGFFRSLLKEQPGNVEAAVRTGRTEVYHLSPNPLSWSAPMVFRTPGAEPMFPVLTSSPACPDVAKYQERRAAYWNALAGMKWSFRWPDGRTPFHDILEQEEQELVDAFRRRQASLLMATRRELRPEESPVTLQVCLYGSVEVDELEGSFAVGGGGIDIQAVDETQELAASGYKLYRDATSATGDKFDFIIRKQGSNIDAPLPEGPLFEVTLELDPEVVEVVYPVSIEVVNVRPRCLVCPGDNAVIVAPS